MGNASTLFSARLFRIYGPEGARSGIFPSCTLIEISQRLAALTHRSLGPTKIRAARSEFFISRDRPQECVRVEERLHR